MATLRHNMQIPAGNKPTPAPLLTMASDLACVLIAVLFRVAVLPVVLAAALFTFLEKTISTKRRGHRDEPLHAAACAGAIK